MYLQILGLLSLSERNFSRSLLLLPSFAGALGAASLTWWCRSLLTPAAGAASCWRHFHGRLRCSSKPKQSALHPSARPPGQSRASLPAQHLTHLLPSLPQTELCHCTTVNSTRIRFLSGVHVFEVCTWSCSPLHPVCLAWCMVHSRCFHLCMLSE